MNIGELFNTKSKTFWIGILMILLPVLEAQGIEVPEGALEALLGGGLMSMRAAVEKVRTGGRGDDGREASPFRR